MESYKRMQGAINVLQEYVNQHAGHPTDKNTDPMAVACGVAIDVMKQMVGNSIWPTDVSLENVVNRMSAPIDCYRAIEERDELQARLEKEAVRGLVRDVLFAGVVDTHSWIDHEKNEFVVMAEMFVGVKNRQDINKMIEEGRDYEKYEDML